VIDLAKLHKGEAENSAIHTEKFAL